MTVIHRLPLASTPRKALPVALYCGVILDGNDADRYLIGYGLSALTDALNGMGRTRSSLDDVLAVYLPDDVYDSYITQGQWRGLSVDPEECRQDDTTLAYMLEKRLLRRGLPDTPADMPRHRAAWELAVRGSLLRCV